MLRWARAAAAGASALVLIGSAGCTRHDGATAASPASTTSASTPPRPRVRVAIVSDSEVTPEIVVKLSSAPGVRVVSQVLEPGKRIEQLDRAIDEALAQKPDVVVYSAGANDLAPLGAEGMLAALHSRIDRLRGATCVVYPVPSIDTSAMDPAQGAEVRTALEGFVTVLDQWGATVVSYPRIAAALQADGRQFYASGKLGEFHPGPAAVEPIAEALAAAVTSCGR